MTATSLEERVPLIVRRVAGSLLLAFVVLGGVYLLSALGVPTMDIKQNRNYGALPIGVAWALFLPRLLDYIFFDVVFQCAARPRRPRCCVSSSACSSSASASRSSSS